MEKEELKQYLKDNLRVEVSVSRESIYSDYGISAYLRVSVGLFLEGELIATESDLTGL